MRKKINNLLVLMAVLGILLTGVLITAVYYELFQEQVMEDLHTYAILLGDGHTVEEVLEVVDAISDEELRVTIVRPDGTVCFDNQVNASQMSNHAMRPEVVAAMENGYGEIIRNSKTLSQDTFYSAVLLEDGGVLRVAKVVGNVYDIAIRAIPGVMLVMALLIVLSFMLARFYTVRVIRPIERLASNLDMEQSQMEYDELIPFVDTIKKQHQDIIRSVKIRQEFTANITHELKTPLTSISGYAELLENGMASENDIQRFAHGIRVSANRLIVMINDIIRLSELDAAETEIVRETVNLYDLARTCVEMLAFNAEQKGVRLSVSGQETLVNGNKQMLEELLYNLCDNAIRYNRPDGKVEVEVYSEDNRPVLKVRDTGIGISKENQPRVFERFYCVDKSHSKQVGGTGLGLAIVKHIVAQHEAQIELESELNVGTTITVTFCK